MSKSSDYLKSKNYEWKDVIEAVVELLKENEELEIKNMLLNHEILLLKQPLIKLKLPTIKEPLVNLKLSSIYPSTLNKYRICDTCEYYDCDFNYPCVECSRNFSDLWKEKENKNEN